MLFVKLHANKERTFSMPEKKKHVYKPFTSRVEPFVYQQMRIYGITHDQSMSEVITQAFQEFLENHR